METKQKNKSVVSVGWKAITDAIGKAFVRVTAKERADLTATANVGLDSFNAYLPKVRVDEVLLAIAIQFASVICETAKTVSARAMFYIVTSPTGELHGGECEVFDVQLDVDLNVTVLWHSSENTFVLLGMVKGLELLTQSAVSERLYRGECYDVQTTLPKDNYFDGKTGLILTSGVLLGDLSKARQALAVVKSDGSLGILDLHSGKRSENERCNATGFAGVTDATQAGKIRLALGIAQSKASQKNEARKSESSDARKARRTAKK